MFLVDSNIWLERLLNQERAGEVADFLNRTPSEQLFITDFAFHSICVVFYRLRKQDALLQLVHDAFGDGAVNLIHLEPQDTQEIVYISQQFSLDFDDSYQYVAAQKYNLTIVSFDTDFDKTSRGRKSPAEVIQE